MGKTRRKDKGSSDVEWDDLDHYISDAFKHNKEAKRKRKKNLAQEYDPEEEVDEAYGSFQKIGKRKCPRTTY